MIPDDLPLEHLIRATQIHGAFIEMGDRITTSHESHLLNELEREHIPVLLPFKHLDYVRVILEAYNAGIKKNTVIYDNIPVKL